MNADKYARGYFMPPQESLEWTHREYLDHAPVWCSVDLRDGNQSLIVPMSLDEKITFYKHLVAVGFKEIEVGFPAASETEYEFLRALIEQDLIPDDVTVQVLTQSREHIIRKTFESLKGCKNAIVHLYNSTSVAQREQVFKKSKEEIKEIAVSGAKLLQEIADDMGVDFRFEYSPESFTGTEVDYALEVCNAVLDVWKPTADRKAIINLPVTVSMSMPHVFASQVEYMCKHLKYRENIVVSLHPHNDRGCAVADSELGLLAGADRLEGTLFGNGERTGNVDLVTVAVNLMSHGVEPGLDFSNLPKLIEVYESCTRMHVYDRQPYSGALVFTAFSGSHQDAIAKGMKWREEKRLHQWTVPYLPIDPKDVGRGYDGDVIRINSQSGKGGIGYLLEQKYGFTLPPKMREDFGYAVKDVSDHQHKELHPEEVYEIFRKNYLNREDVVRLEDYHYVRYGNKFKVTLTVEKDGKLHELIGGGNGRLDAVSEALKEFLGISWSNLNYTEHTLGSTSGAQAAAYVGLTDDKGIRHWGAGTADDIIAASIKALFAAINQMLTQMG